MVQVCWLKNLLSLKTVITAAQYLNPGTGRPQRIAKPWKWVQNTPYGYSLKAKLIKRKVFTLWILNGSGGRQFFRKFYRFHEAKISTVPKNDFTEMKNVFSTRFLVNFNYSSKLEPKSCEQIAGWLMVIFGSKIEAIIETTGKAPPRFRFDVKSFDRDTLLLVCSLNLNYNPYLFRLARVSFRTWPVWIISTLKWKGI